MKHTREPWIAGEYPPGARVRSYAAMSEDGALLASMQTVSIHVGKLPGKANAARIVACINACAGIEDPAAELARLRRVEGAAREVLTETVQAGEFFTQDYVSRSALDSLRSALEG